MSFRPNTGGKNQIFVMNADCSNVVQLTTEVHVVLRSFALTPISNSNKRCQNPGALQLRTDRASRDRDEELSSIVISRE